MKEELVQVERGVIKHGQPISQHYWVRVDQVQVGDVIITPPTTNYHINRIEYDDSVEEGDGCD